MFADGMSSNDIVSELPELEQEDIAEALRYAAQTMLAGVLPERGC